jgi:hypothetical protein
MNIYLLLSSIISGLIISRIIYKKYNIKLYKIYTLVIIGIITSILNHGTSNKYFKYLDRIIITLTIIYTFYSIKNNITRGILVFASGFYFISKIPNLRKSKLYLHLSSHLMGILLVYQIHNKILLI